MKTLFLFRSSFDAQYILSKLNEKQLVQGVILESGKKARYRKLQRLFRGSSVLCYPKIFVDVLSLLVYSFSMEKGMAKRLKHDSYPKDKIQLFVQDANDPECIHSIRKYRPDIIFVYGTAILGKEFLKKIHSTILNIHSGILPHYRNVHSDFWAYLKKDYTNIGISLFFLDNGIDSGDICLQKRIQYSKNDHLVDIKVKNLALIPEFIETVLRKYNNKTLPRVKQKTSPGAFYLTPTCKDIITLFFREVLN